MEYSNSRLLIEPAELSARLGDESLRVFDASVILEPAAKGYRARSGLADYREAHVPGAAFLDLITDLSDTTSGLGFTLPAVADLQAALGAAGVSADSSVVVYSSGHMMWATRAWWLLHYAGHSDVAVLDGGFAAWRGAGLPVESGDESYSARQMAATARPGCFVARDDVVAAMNDERTCTVNALSPGVYSGDAEMSYGRKGHITGSLNLPYDNLLDGGRFRPAAELERALRDHGMLDADRVITYCGGGISATIDAFACLLVGKEEIAVYDGSMSEWVRDESLPMTLGNEPG